MTGDARRAAGLLVCSNVLMTFVIDFTRRPLKLDDLWASLCVCGAVCFVSRGR